jgi:hypothetical protein
VHEALALADLGPAALTADAEVAVDELDRKVLGREAGQVHGEDEIGVADGHVSRGREGRSVGPREERGEGIEDERHGVHLLERGLVPQEGY